MAPDEVCESREADGSAQDTAKSENPHPATTGLGPWQIVVWLAVGMGIVVAMATLLSDSQFPSVFWGMAILAFTGMHLETAIRYHGARRRIELAVRAISSLGLFTAIALSSTLSTPMFMLLFGMSMGLDIVKDYFVERWYPETPKG